MRHNRKFILTLAVICMMMSSVLGSNGSVFAHQPEIEASFKEVLNEDKTEATITMNLHYDQEKFRVDKIIQPDLSEILPTEDAKLSTSSYLAKANETVEFEVQYTSITTQEEYKQTFSYEVKGIVETKKSKTIDETEQKNEINEEASNSIKKQKNNAKSTVSIGDKFTSTFYNYEVTTIDPYEVSIVGVDITSDAFDEEFPSKHDYGDYYIPDQVENNGIIYTVSGIKDFSTHAGNSIVVYKLHLPITVKTIAEPEKNGNGVFMSYEISLLEMEGIEYIGFQAFSNNMNTFPKLNFSNIKYIGENAFDSNVNLEEITFNEGLLEIDDLAFASLGNAPVSKIDLPKSTQRVGYGAFADNINISEFSLWNTTNLDEDVLAFYGFTPEKQRTVLLKSDSALDFDTDVTYLTLRDKSGLIPENDKLVYGQTEVKTTSDRTQTLKPGKSTTFNVSVEKKIGNDVMDTGDKYDKNWISGEYTYSIEGNNSTSTKMDGDKLTVGSDETATTIKVKAISTFDTSKFVEFTIDVDQTQDYVAQIIKNAKYDESTGTYFGGTYVDSYITLQAAINALDGTDNEVIEVLVDYEMPGGDLAVIKNKNISLTTAPKINHSAAANASGDTPHLFTGTGSKAVIRRSVDKRDNLITISGTSKVSISNLTLDGANIKTDRNTLLISDSSTLNLKIGTTIQNGNVVGYSTNINNDSGRGTIYIKNGTLNIYDGVIIKNNRANMGGGIFVSGGTTNLYGGSINNNIATNEDGADRMPLEQMGKGGGIFLKGGILNLTGGTIQNNTSSTTGGGIEMNSFQEESFIDCYMYVSGNPKVKNNQSAGINQNIFLGTNHYISVSGEIVDDAEIGITAQGNDANAKDRMTQSAQFGINVSNDQEVLDSLKKLFRDNNGIAPDGMNLYGKDGGLFVPGDPDAGTPDTYKVIWEANIYKVTFNPMGGTLNSIEEVELNEGDIITKPTDPTYAGHTFEGWYTDDQFTNEWNFNTAVTTDMTLYAKWNPISYRIHFDKNTGKGIMNDMDFSVGDDITLTKNVFTKMGFEFDGWNTQANGTGTAYNDEAVINDITAGSITLYAQWKVQGPSVFVEIPKAIELKDDTDGYAKKAESVRIVKDVQDESWYPDEDIQIRASTSITLKNDKNGDEFIVSVFKADDSQYTDGSQPLAILNVKDTAKQSEKFMLKTKMNPTKMKARYIGIMNFIIEFMP